MFLSFEVLFGKHLPCFEDGGAVESSEGLGGGSTLQNQQTATLKVVIIFMQMRIEGGWNVP